MSDVSTWDTVADNNNAPPPDGFPEGQTAGSLNDCSREVMAAVARWRDGFYVTGNATITGTLGVSNTAPSTTLEVGSDTTPVGDTIARLNGLNANNKSVSFAHQSVEQWRIQLTGGAEELYLASRTNVVHVFTQAGEFGVNTGGTDPVTVMEVKDNGTKPGLLRLTSNNETPYSAIFSNATFSATTTDGLTFKVTNSGVCQMDTQGTNTQLDIMANGVRAIHVASDRTVTFGQSGGGAGRVLIEAQDGTSEGGHMEFVGAGTYNTIITDNAAGNLRCIFNATPTQHARFYNSGSGYASLAIGTVVASGGHVLLIQNGSAPTSSPANSTQLYSEDVSNSSELKVRDEAGNITVLSPHNFEGIPDGPSEDMAWSYHSERDGKSISVDMLAMIREVEKLSGRKLVHESTV